MGRILLLAVTGEENTKTDKYTYKGYAAQCLCWYWQDRAAKEDLSGFWSRRIDEVHRIVINQEKDGAIIIASCRGHYED